MIKTNEESIEGTGLRELCRQRKQTKIKVGKRKPGKLFINLTLLLLLCQVLNLHTIEAYLQGNEYPGSRKGHY